MSEDLQEGQVTGKGRQQTRVIGAGLLQALADAGRQDWGEGNTAEAEGWPGAFQGECLKGHLLSSHC